MHLADTGCEGTDWIRVPNDRDQWRAFMTQYSSMGFHKSWRIFLFPFQWVPGV
jgi:hypothetical protein